MPQISRRGFLQSAVCAGALVFAPRLGAAAGLRFDADPFSLGVASGSPTADGFVIWTRLAPEPRSANPAGPGGVTSGDVEIRYEVAADDSFRSIVRRGTCIAERAFAHSVHLEMSGLDAWRPYWYRFMSGDAVSRTGRAMTAPAIGSPLERLRLGFVSCSNYEHGYFAGYRHLADESPDIFLCLGDYIYEGVDTTSRTVRRHSDGIEAKTLAAYRNRYAQYRLDPDLQRLHAEVPALVTWDDHEVQNDYADRWSQNYDETEGFLQRRAAAYQAFYEHMPVRASRSLPNGPMMRIYDRYTFGALAEIAMIDVRQYRSRQACYEERRMGRGHLETRESCPELLAAQRSMLGPEQERWLFDGLSGSRSRWNIIAQDVLMAQLRERNDRGEIGYWTNDWNGYPKARKRLINHLHESRVANPVVFTGDIHSYWANDLKLDFDDPTSPVVATELVGTSISSHGREAGFFERFLPDNPHVKFVDSSKRGYVFVELAPRELTARDRAVSEGSRR